ncbi:toxin-antitoxin system TumE family protein [Dapis sp. BLCC M229]|uniref:toxin-antitoxin system TumE family protein n=1 Tax=Dapis sp. BLCC M229 TaxID=3400188 RepID=UPI003CF79B12
MLFEDYLQQLHDSIVACEVVQHFQLLNEALQTFSIIQNCTFNPKKQGTYQGFIRGEARFKDNSMLYFCEFVDVKITVERDMYSYQYMTASNNFIFRYDNTGHHKKLNLPNFPHHKHEGSQENVISSNAPTLVEVLHEIDSLLR